MGWRIHQWGGTPTWEEIAEPAAGPGEVLVEVEACGVGLTVLNCINGDLDDGSATLPRVPGHELIGRVTETGRGVDSTIIGKRIAAYFYLVCGQCDACQGGRDPHCSNLAGWVGVHLDGGYAPRVTLPARNAVVMPDDLDPVAATVVPDAVATPVHVGARADIHPGDRVVVIGAGGGVGVHMLQVAAHRGGRAAGLDITDTKLALIEEMGATPVRSDDFDEIDSTSIFSTGAPTVVVDLLGTTASTRWSIDSLAVGGRLVTLTTFPERPVDFESRELVFRELSILGSRYSFRRQVAEAGELVASGAIKPIIGEVTKPQDVIGLHSQLEAGSLVGRGAIDWNRA